MAADEMIDMEELPFNLPVLTAIWTEIDSFDDSRLREYKEDVCRKYKALVDNPLSSSAHLRFSDEGILLEPSPKAIMLFLLGTMNFMLAINRFYEKLATIRPLQPKDKQMGERLQTLLDQNEENLTRLKKWNAAILASEERLKFEHSPATPAKEAV